MSHRDRFLLVAATVMRLSFCLRRATECSIMFTAHVLALALAPLSAVQDGAREASLRGRVVDSQGKPVTNATIRLWQKVQHDGKPLENEQVRFDGAESIRTDATGRFLTPALPDPNHPVRVIALADGFLAARSPWIKPDQAKSVN